jgi:hypothetical protein
LASFDFTPYFKSTAMQFDLLLQYLNIFTGATYTAAFF